MATTFHSINVYPAYGAMSARIAWRMLPGHESGRFLVYKSDDGVSDWKQIGTVDNGQEFLDPNLLANNKLSEAYYRVIQQANGRRSDSDIVGTFGQVSRQEFCAARYIMDLEFKHLRQFGVSYLFKLRSGAAKCPVCTDPATGQKLATSLCESCYGTGVDGGYHPAIKTHARIRAVATRAKVDRPDGAGTDEPVNTRLRMLAFPMLDKGDLVVMPASDQRYLVDVIDYSLVGGKIPVVAEVTTQLLRRTDVRYRLKP